MTMDQRGFYDSFDCSEDYFVFGSCSIYRGKERYRVEIIESIGILVCSLIMHIYFINLIFPRKDIFINGLLRQEIY